MSVSIREAGKTTTGTPVREAILKNDKLEVHILGYGAIISQLLVPDKNGNPVDVALGYTTPANYELNSDSMGVVIGRFANRIAGASFTIDESTYHVTANEGANCLHSGLHGFNHTVFELHASSDESAVSCTAISPDGTDGFPGTVQLEVQYSLTSNGLVIRYYATTDVATVINITNHCYFNLNGQGSGSVLGHRLSIESDEYLEGDDASIPTGRILPVEGTPMDFREEKTIGRDIEANFLALQQGHGYDHCYLLPDSGLRHAAWLIGPATGIRMETLTTQPAMQLYTANFLAPTTPGKGGAAYGVRDAVCLETQHYPDSPHHAEFPDVVLRPGETFDETTVYKFDIAPL